MVGLGAVDVAVAQLPVAAGGKRDRLLEFAAGFGLAWV